MEGIRFIPKFVEVVRSRALSVEDIQALMVAFLDINPGPESRNAASTLLAHALFPCPGDLSGAARMMRKKARDLRAIGLASRAILLDDDADFLERPPKGRKAPATIQDIDEAAREARPRVRRIAAKALEVDDAG